MHIVRTIIWVLLVVGLLIFSVANWDPIVTLRIWPGLVVDTKIPVIVTITFLIGFLPTWMYLRGAKWKLKRRIHSLEQAARYGAATPVPVADPVPEPVGMEKSPLSPETPAPDDKGPPLA